MTTFPALSDVQLHLRQNHPVIADRTAGIHSPAECPLTLDAIDAIVAALPAVEASNVIVATMITAAGISLPLPTPEETP